MENVYESVFFSAVCLMWNLCDKMLMLRANHNRKPATELLFGNKNATSVWFSGKNEQGRGSNFLPTILFNKQAAQNRWKHDNVHSNKLGQRTDFGGPIIAGNLLRNSWLGPAGEKKD